MTGLLSTLLLKESLRERLDRALAEALEDERVVLELYAYRAVFLDEVGRPQDAWAVFHEGERLGLCDLRTADRHVMAQRLAKRAIEPEAGPGSVTGRRLDEITPRVAEAPEHVGLRLRQARLLQLEQRNEEALGAIHSAIELNPQYWALHHLAGEILIAMKKPKEAASSFEKAIDLLPTFEPARLRLAQSLAEAGEVAGATRAFVPYAGLWPPGSATLELTRLLGEAARAETSTAVFGEAIAADPSNPYLRAHHAALLHRAGKTAVARREALDAQRLGLDGRDGRPAALLLDVFGREEKQAKKAGGDR